MARANGAAADLAGEVNGSAQTAAEAYDRIPYDSNPFPESQPERLAAIGHLLGFESVPIETARVLEIGMAAGGNIIPLAVRYPNAHFVGIDVSQVQVARAQATITAAGLTNIEARQQSVTELVDGEFDYIICHGVYSWVTSDIQDAILDVLQTHLSPTGIGYISYNVLPGWRQLQIVRDSLMILVASAAPTERPRLAREFLAKLVEQVPQAGPYGETIRQQAKVIEGYDDYYIAHEHLEAQNHPCTFTSFCRALGTRSLAYLAEADFASMLPESWVGEGSAALRQLSGNGLIETEQAIDILTGRTFRRTLIVHAGHGQTLDRTVAPARLDGLHLIAPFDIRRQADAGPDTIVFGNGRGATLRTSSAIVAAAIDAMTARLPASVTVAELVAGIASTEADAIRDALFKMLVIGMIAVSVRPVEATTSHPDRPIALPSARADAAHGAKFTASLRHEPVALDVVAHNLLPLFDGTNNLDDCCRAIFAKAREGVIYFLRDGQPIRADEAMAAAREHVERVLGYAARAGLLLTFPPANVPANLTKNESSARHIPRAERPDRRMRPVRSSETEDMV